MACAGSFQGTRETKSFSLSHPASRNGNNRTSRDVGLSKRVVANATFSGNTIFDSGSTFTVFKVGDVVEIVGTAGGLNNGRRLILAVVPTSITVDFPVKTEGPTAGVEIRTP